MNTYNTYNMYMIETLTNMHVGSGDTHFGIVDNLIQRSPVTKVPVIHSSGLKGSLREYFVEPKLSKDEIRDLFGADVEEGNSEKSDQFTNTPGHLIFFEANMLTLPLRSNQNIYYNCTSEDVLLDYLKSVKDFVKQDLIYDEIKNWLGTMNFSSHDFYYFKGDEGIEIEDFTKGKLYLSTIPDSVKTFLSNYCKIEIDKLAIFGSSIFGGICKESIPVVARNRIDKDGTSGNLFYEEVLPRKTKLYFVLGYDSYLNQTSKDSLRTKFETEFNNSVNIYQFGANYSIGYGFSKIEKVI